MIDPARATMADEHKVDAVARCLVQLDHGFVSGTDWQGEVGREYRRRARRVLMTIRNYDNGVRSGGLPLHADAGSQEAMPIRNCYIVPNCRCVIDLGRLDGDAPRKASS